MLYFGMSYGEYILLAEVVTEQKLQIVHRNDAFVNILILVLIYILLFGYVIWRTHFIS